jgi:hypothetical protein
MNISTNSELTLKCYSRMCLLVALHVGIILGALFSVTNAGRRVSFGHYYFDDYGANLFVFFFWLLASAIVISSTAILSFFSVNRLLRLTGGLQLRGQ